MNESGNFFSSLFDLSFREFITPSIIGVIYVLLMILSGILALIVLTATTFQTNIILGLVTGTVTFLLLLIFHRVSLEVSVAPFRIAENTTTVARNTRRSDTA